MAKYILQIQLKSNRLKPNVLCRNLRRCGWALCGLLFHQIPGYYRLTPHHHCRSRSPQMLNFTELLSFITLHYNYLRIYKSDILFANSENLAYICNVIRHHRFR